MIDRTRWMWLLLIVLVLLGPTALANSSEEEAQRQLELAEQDLDDDNYERAATAAASALRLDPGRLDALVVRALALRGLGRLEDAAGLLRAYRDLRGSLPHDERVGPAMADLERLLAAQREPAAPEPPPTPGKASGPLALLYGPERPGAAEDAWAAAGPFLGDAPPVAVIPLRSVLPAPGQGLLAYGATSTACPAALPEGTAEEHIAAATKAVVELEVEAADIAIAAAELHLACGTAPAGPDQVARLLAVQAAARWFAGEPERATGLWQQVFVTDPQREVDASIAPTATALQLTAKTRAADEPVRGQLDLALPAGWAAWVDGRAVDADHVVVPRGRRLVRVLDRDGEAWGTIVTVAEGQALVATAEGLREAIESPAPPAAILRALAPPVEDAARREGATGALVVNLLDPVVVHRVEGGRWLVLTPPTTSQASPGRGARARATKAGPSPGPVALLAGGLAASAVGVVMSAVAHRDGVALASEMWTPRGYGDHYLDYEAVRLREQVGAGLAIGGGVVAAVGVVTFSIPAPSARRGPEVEAVP